MYLTYIISKPALTSSGSSLTSFSLCAGKITALTPAVSAPMSFSLMPPKNNQLHVKTHLS